jgi:hypothetical protein
VKKIIIPSVIVVWVLIAQGFYILKLKHDLGIRKLVNEETILQVLDRKFEYTKNEDNQAYQQPLDEPDCLNEQSDTIERIEMLEMHLDYNPSKKWIKDVLSDAKNKLDNPLRKKGE